MSITFREISLVFEVSFSVPPPLPHFPRNLRVTPLPKTVSLHCAHPSRFPDPLLIIIAQSLRLFARTTPLVCADLNDDPL